MLDAPPPATLLAIDVESFNGNVVVRADAGPDAPITVETDAQVSGGVPDEGRDAYLDLPQVSADVEEAGGRAVLRVRSTSAAAWDENHRANLHITVPRCDGVEIDNRGGYVMVVAASGAATIENHGGSIEFRTDKLMNAPVTMTTSGGDIWYQVPIGSQGRFDLETLKGEVAMKDDSGNAGGTWSQRERLSSTVGSGEFTVLARTNEGNIRVWIMEDPMALVRAMKRDWRDWRDSMHMQTSRRFRRNLPDDHPEVYKVPVRNHYEN